MDGSLYLLTALASILLFLHYRWRTRHFRRLAGKIPGPPTVPLLGHCLNFLGHPDDTMDKLLTQHQVYGDVSTIWVGPRLYVMLTEPRDVEALLGNPRIRNRDSAMCWVVEDMFGKSILTTAGDKWKTHRKLITPLFHFRILETYVEVFGRKSTILLGRLDGMADGRTFDVYNLLSMSTLDSICETAIGINMNTQVETESAFSAAIVRGIELLHDRILRPWLLVKGIYALSENSRKTTSTVKELQTFTEKIIRNKLGEYRSGKRRGADDAAYLTTIGDKRIVPFSDMLIESSENNNGMLTLAEIRDEVTTVAASGLETTATTMSSLILMAAMYPHVQDEICKELKAVFGNDTRPATKEDISKMQYMKMAIKETLRLFPTVSVLPREVTEDLELPSGYTLPAGCSAIVLSYVTHRDGRYWPDAESFLPDRWLSQEVRHPYAYIPFSAGPRNCVGQKYAALQMCSVLSAVFRRYRVTTTTKMADLKRIRVSMTSSPAVGYKIQLHKRCDAAP